MHEKSNITTDMDKTTISEQNEFHNLLALNSFSSVILLAFGQSNRQYGKLMKFTVFRMHKQKTTIHSHLMHAIHYFCVDRKRRVENVKTNQEARKSIEIEKCCPIDSRSTVGAKNQASIFGVF